MLAKEEEKNPRLDKFILRALRSQPRRPWEEDFQPRAATDPTFVERAWIWAAEGLMPVNVDLVQDFGSRRNGVGVAVFRLTEDWVNAESGEPSQNPVRCFFYDRQDSYWVEAQKYTPEILALSKESIVEIERLTRKKFGRTGEEFSHSDPYPYNPDTNPER